uniref:EGF-like domain-containing protein n=1 Tax=Amphimedon queenslandica TaxID=400682 RepID=A0A1X7SHW9_AMPQE
INECAINNESCEQLCINSNGSYWCSCLSGYTLDTNSMNCTGIECSHSLVYCQ